MTDWLSAVLNATKPELVSLIEQCFKSPPDSLFHAAKSAGYRYYQNDVYIRGLIEFTNYCTNNCLYCGLRNGNKKLKRYRLSEKAILACCEAGHKLGLRSFVLQGGEDPYFTDDKIVSIVQLIKHHFPQNAITLSFGEKAKDTYQRYRDAGADRYLLRHESANAAHYAQLHPSNMRLEKRKNCLFTLKEIGFEVGAGFMVGSPWQTSTHLAEDLLFLKELKPHMVGIGPFISHQDTPFAAMENGKIPHSIVMLALTKLMLPDALYPATTAVSTLSDEGRAMAFAAGANVVMPNLSPQDYRKDYALYDNKAYTHYEAAENIQMTMASIRNAGLIPRCTRGDPYRMQ